jgi:hypothetical protein
MSRSGLVSRLFAVCFLSLTLASCAERAQLPAKSFEGTITEVIKMPGLADLVSGDTNSSSGMGGIMGAMANMTVKMYVRPDKIAYDMSTLGGLITVHTIIDRNTRKLIMLMPNKTAMVTDLRSFDSIRGKLDDSMKARMGLLDTLAHLMPRPTGKTETVEGMSAEQYVASSGDISTELWLSDDSRVKALDVVRDALLGRHRTGEGGMEQAFAMMAPIAGKLPVKFETRYKGKVVMTGGLRSIDEGKVEDEQFVVPEGYRLVNGDSARTAREHPKTFTGPDTTE